MSSPVSSKSLETSLPIDPTLFTTQDINAILIRCEELRDWKSGWYISNTLLRRYQMPGFDFSASKFGAPNARTIHLLAKLFIRSNHFSRAEALFSVLHQSYPHPIPLDIYTAYLSELATKNQVSQIESTLRHLETAGPHPTVTQYNTLLRAIGRHRGVEQAEELFARMVQAGIVPDQQTYRILIDESLSDVDMAKAHSWLGKYMRQGFEINARMMEPFMNTCVNQVCLFESKESKAVVVDRVSLSHEWMLKAMNILHFMSRQELLPTARTFDLLMKGFLAQKNVSEVHNVLTLMRSSPYFYVPDPSIWISLFKYHLKRNEPLLALKALNDMGNSKDDLKPGEIPTGAVVPKALYRKLFRHYLKKDNLSMAERSLYEMLVQIKGTRPNEQDIIDLIWKLENRPEAAERVYELLYSQSGQWVSRDIKSIRKNRIIEEGPIQLANVGVMRAMANSKNRRVREIVWKSWISMIRYLDEAGSTRDISLGERFSMIINPKEMSVLTLAFEQVAKAAYREPMTGHDARQTSENTTDTKSRIVSNNWDFSYGRRKPGISGVGLGLLGGYFRSEMLPASGGMNDRESRAEATTRLFGLHGKHKLLVQRLLRHQEFVRPLLERRNMTIAPSGTPSEALFSLSSISIDDTLGQLKSSYQWVQEHSVPIRIEGFNAYLKGLLSHEDFKSARDVLSEFLTEQDYAFDSPCKLSVSDENASKTTLASLIPNIDTIKIVKEYKGVIGGRDTIDQIFRKGGPNLSKEWMIYSSKSYQKQASTTSDKLSSPPPLASTSLSTPTKTVVV
ncbi:hypothetical protein FBU30_001273 [Linnemannia zychae]|nr:hypothetical protein FBU30_001273 [Linnemannia zychae]